MAAERRPGLAQAADARVMMRLCGIAAVSAAAVLAASLCSAAAGVPCDHDGYYVAASGLRGVQLKRALHDIVSRGSVVIPYTARGRSSDVWFVRAGVRKSE